MYSVGMSFLPFRNTVHLTEQEAHDLMDRILSGDMSTDELAGLLMFLRQKGETVHEVVGFASGLRALSRTVSIDQADTPLVDTCGTGGDHANTFNVSTATAFVAAGAGLRVAKHGNRRISSQCGSADVLEQLNVAVDLSPDQVAECIAENGIGFLYAPSLHPGMRHAQEARQRLAGRTIFNLLGPLTNPVRARLQLVGAFSVRAAELIAHAAARLGVERAYVVHGSDELDEISTTGVTTVFQVDDGRVQKGQWDPSDFGVEQVPIEALQGGDPAANAEIIRSILAGETGPKRDIVLVNAAAALLLGRKAEDLGSAIALARESIDSGAAREKLEQLVTFSSRVHHEVV
jgi:anthranilate phosphoribosyltransferase